MITRRRLLLTLPLLLAGCRNKRPPFQNTDITGANIGSDFTLTDCYGAQAKLANFQGKVVILFFGYTSCPDVCPTALAKFASLMQQPGITPETVQVIFISLDPARDTAQHLCEYTRWFHPSFIGLTGDSHTIKEIAAKFRVTSIKKEIGGEMGYVLDHSAGAYVFGPDGRIRLYLAENAKPEAIAEDIRHLLARE
jgi:protein SCO1/2